MDLPVRAQDIRIDRAFLSSQWRGTRARPVKVIPSIKEVPFVQQVDCGLGAKKERIYLHSDLEG